MGCSHFLLLVGSLGLAALGFASLGNEFSGGPFIGLFCGVLLAGCIYLYNRYGDVQDPLLHETRGYYNFGAPLAALVLIVGGLIGSVGVILSFLGIIDGPE